ncbi:hypothetical protein BG004_002103 [Podila humilis]|nr:hypothetical protein BG004_002103 [Podila humilis]
MSALIEMFKTLTLPEHTTKEISIGQLGGDHFEQALFHQLIRASKPIVLNATDLNGRNRTTVKLDFSDYQTLPKNTEFLRPGHENTLIRGYEGYP